MGVLLPFLLILGPVVVNMNLSPAEDATTYFVLYKGKRHTATN